MGPKTKPDREVAPRSVPQLRDRFHFLSVTPVW